MDFKEITAQSRQAVNEILEQARLKKGDIFVVGCSSSEILGDQIGTATNLDSANAVFDGIVPVLEENGILIAAQCCEHLNRAVIIEADAVPAAEIVNVIPQPKAGGSFATAAYHSFQHPVALEEIKADAGLDIGGTLIGMHLKKVAVPVRLQQDHIGEAILIAARVRPKFIGGNRAVYDEWLKGD